MRVAIACAVVHGMPITVHSIRAGRPKPGLGAQHLKGLEMVATLCGGQLTGAHLHSTEITLTPRQIKPGHYHADTQTAGSVTLLLQASLPCALYAKGPTHLTLLGGTNTDMAPPVDYTQNVFMPMAALFGMKFSLDVVRRGFYPRGGGELLVQVQALTQPLSPVTLLDRGKMVSIGGTCYVSGLPPRLASLAVDAATAVLRARLLQPGQDDVPISVRKEVVPETHFTGKGLGIVLWCKTDTGIVLGSSHQAALGGKRGPGTPAETVGRTAAVLLCEDVEQQVCLDREMQNQVILLMGLAAGRSSVLVGPLSLHTRTAIEIMQQTTKATFTTSPRGDLIRIDCDGIGLDPDSLSCTT